MSSTLKSSLLTRTLLFVGIASAAVATLFILITLAITERRAEEQANARLNELIDSSSVMASISCFANDATLAAETAQAFVKNSDVLSVAIRSRKGELAHALRPEAEAATDLDNSPPLVRAIYSPFDSTEVIGEILVHPNWEEIRKSVSNDVRFAGVVLALVTVGIVGVIAIVVTLLVIRPVKSISDKLHAMDAATGETLAVPATHANNELGRLVGDINDLVGRFRSSLEQEHELHLQRVISEKLRLAAEVFEHSPEGIMITDHDNRIIAINRAFTQITGYAEDEVIGADPRILSSGRHLRSFFEELWDTLLRQGFWKGELWNRRKNGEIVPKWFTINSVKDESGRIINYVAIFSDISDRKLAEEQIEFLAHHDPLTGLPNRVLLRDRFSQARATAHREKWAIAVMFLDLDNFKHVNDSLGHQAGDQLLIDVVQRLRSLIRDTDTICRQGGDEFIAILPGIHNIEAVSRVARQMLEVVSATTHIENHPISISASIGITLYPYDGDDFDTLLSNADAAMYDVKSSGRNGYRFFTEKMNADSLRKLHMQAHLRNALPNGEFLLHYQPQIDLASGRVTGVEALIRWKHPEMGLVSPANFIPLAEECGLIVPIGEWVLAEAGRQGRLWLDAGLPPLLIAVNISAVQFNRGDILETVRIALEKSGFPADLLELEITESALLQDVGATLETIRNLKALGVKVSIDDFGTGYSSLSYLKKIKVDKLKIDQSFVRDIGHDTDDLAIVRAIIQLGKMLQLRVTAEGVETAEQLDILKHYGCDEAQGYYYGHPQPPSDLTAWIAAPDAASGRA